MSTDVILLSQGLYQFLVLRFPGLLQSVLVFRLLGQQLLPLNLCLHFDRNIRYNQLHDSGHYKDDMLKDDHKGEPCRKDVPVLGTESVAILVRICIPVAAIIANVWIFFRFSTPFLLVVGCVERCKRKRYN